jgi:inorganic pyrophosphatase
MLYINEIPLGTREKLEIVTKEEYNPIRQDRVKKSNALRLFTYGDIPFNYGCLPGTWEDPSVVYGFTKCVGDGDPVDAVEISRKGLPIGSISGVRVLGALALIDEGETDWKIIVAPFDDPRFQRLTDVPSEVLDSISLWFRMYKTTDGKAPNEFAFEGRIRDADFAMDVVTHCQRQYEDLICGKCENPGVWVPSSKEGAPKI